MLRIRHADGTTQDVPSGTFLELVDPVSGAVGTVWFQQSPNCVLRIVPGTVDAGRYSNMFGVKFNPIEIVRSDLINR